ncbi:unnamed protein product [Protopolystoma xenopodis]|uniref:Uncharacterized protein n=1 Tax=Protopolystoma xenopodis TaxID=117903 RepID=A0A448WJD0_9PLAT|nr:unnamed protein product [Protopolystoma xenopodis]
MAKLTDDADATFDNVPSRLSGAGTHDNYYGRRLRTRCVLLSRPDNKNKLRQRGLPSSIGLINLTTRTTYFTFNGTISEQIVGLAMGSGVFSHQQALGPKE